MVEDETPATRRLADLERRVAALESAASGRGTDRSSDAPVAGGELWALSELKRRVGRRDAVLFTGTKSTEQGGKYEWQFGMLVDDLIGEMSDTVDISRFTDVLAALAHPARLRVLVAVLEGRDTAADLGSIDGSGTTGQLYHHIRQLTAAGWLRSVERGRYQIPPDRVVPLLAVLAAARR